MADFINTIDVLGDEAVTKLIVEKTITEFLDDLVNVVGDYVFNSCASLANVNLPNVTSVLGSAFAGCKALVHANLPNVTILAYGIFENCIALTSMDMPNVTSIGSNAFKGCNVLKTLILRAESVCSLSASNSFTKTPFASGNAGGTLLVPRSLTTEYPNATNWSSVISGNANNRVLALQDYTVDGTITGEIDWDKLNGGN
jgi:hypothetical protein